MNRRAFVGLLCAGATTVAGCSTPGGIVGSDGESDAIEDRQLDLVDPEPRFGANGSGWSEGSLSGADVRFETAMDRVVVLGHLNSGSRSCKETLIESARYDDGSETLTVVILDRYDGSNTCTLEKAIVPYEATITFDDAFPERVVVKHRAGDRGIVYSETFTTH